MIDTLPSPDDVDKPFVMVKKKKKKKKRDSKISSGLTSPRATILSESDQEEQERIKAFELRQGFDRQDSYYP